MRRSICTRRGRLKKSRLLTNTSPNARHLRHMTEGPQQCSQRRKLCSRREGSTGGTGPVAVEGGPESSSLPEQIAVSATIRFPLGVDGRRRAARSSPSCSRRLLYPDETRTGCPRSRLHTRVRLIEAGTGGEVEPGCNDSSPTEASQGIAASRLRRVCPHGPRGMDRRKARPRTRGRPQPGPEYQLLVGPERNRSTSDPATPLRWPGGDGRAGLLTEPEEIRGRRRTPGSGTRKVRTA